MAPTVSEEQLYFSSSSTPHSLLEQYRLVRAFSEELCQPLSTEDYVVQSMEDASPAKWHLAHTTWFFETFVLQSDPNYEPRHPQYAFLFNSYYVQAGARYPRPRRGLVTRPTVKEVYQYRRDVDEQVIQWMKKAGRERWAQLAPIIEIGVHHEQQHQELMLTDLKHVFSFNPLFPTYSQDHPSSRHAPELEWLSFPEDLYSVGHSGQGFCYDNETPRHRQFVDTFQMANRPVTNKEYLEFMEAGGYETPTLWLSDGWYAVEAEQWRGPLYWRPLDGEWHSFTLNGFRPVNPEEPVCHLSFYEADAFARWAGARLPTEAEWEVASGDLPWRGNFADSRSFHPQPGSAPAGGQGSVQLFGDVWEWTRSPYTAYPGYRPMPGALGEYNGKFMCNQMVLRGGSCATHQSHIRNTYRNFFPPSARWQFSGLRLFRDA